MHFHSGPRFQRGRGIGSIFSGLMRAFRPIATMGLNAGKKFLKSDLAKNIGSTVTQMGSDALRNVAVDVLEGKSLKDSAKDQLEMAKNKIAETLRGRGRSKRKNKHSLSKENQLKKVKYNLLLD